MEHRLMENYTAGYTQMPQGTFPTLTPLSATGALAGLAPQWTIGPITLGGQQSWPVTPQTITPGGGGGGGTFTPITPQTLTPVTPQVTPHTVTPVTPQVTPHTLTPVTPGTFTPIAGGAGAAPQWTIGPITLGGQQSWPVSAHTITGGWSGPVTQLTQQVTPATLQLTQHLTPVFGAAA